VGVSIVPVSVEEDDVGERVVSAVETDARPA